MISNLAVGAGFSAFVALLIPPYVTNATGSAGDAGVVMAVLILAAVLGPVLGGVADKYRAHRLIMNLGMLGMAIAFFAFGTSALSTSFFAIDAIIMGVAVAAVSAVAPVFIVGTKLPNWSYSGRFYLAAAFIFVAFLITWFTSKKPAQRIIVEDVEKLGKETAQTRKVGISGVLLSTFGIYLLILVLSSIANNGVNTNRKIQQCENACQTCSRILKFVHWPKGALQCHFR
jgi:hypothetical protein